MASIEYGRSRSGQIVRVADARCDERYTCPTCGNLLELRSGPILAAYFAHWRNLPGAKDCELFSPGDDGQGATAAATSRRPLAGVEDSPLELGLVLDQVDGRWGLGLRLPEIPSDELGQLSLGTLRSALVNVDPGEDSVISVSALDLRPGVGAARVDVLPRLRAFRTQPSGSWPSTVDTARWQLESRGLKATGVLFRLRRGEWMRLLAESAVHRGESLLLLAEACCTPPVVSELHTQISSGGLSWAVWEVQVPSEPADTVTRWLSRLGHDLVPRPWSLELATPARAHSSRGVPIFWVGDSPVITLEAPQPAAIATVAFFNESNSESAGVSASQSRVAHVGVEKRDAGPTRLTVTSERSASLDIEFIERPLYSAVLQLLGQTPRLRVQIGEQSLEAWQGTAHSVRVPAHELPAVHVDLGPERARARITVWERGKRRSRRGLDARGAERAIDEALGGASRIELDADNLGRVVILPAHQGLDAPRYSNASDRLAWRDLVVSQGARAEELATPTLLGQPRAATALAARQVGAAGLVRARLALRRRNEAGRTRP